MTATTIATLETSLEVSLLILLPLYIGPNKNKNVDD